MQRNVNNLVLSKWQIRLWTLYLWCIQIFGQKTWQLTFGPLWTKGKYLRICNREWRDPHIVLCTVYNRNVCTISRVSCPVQASVSPFLKKRIFLKIYTSTSFKKKVKYVSERNTVVNNTFDTTKLKQLFNLFQFLFLIWITYEYYLL